MTRIFPSRLQSYYQNSYQAETFIRSQRFSQMDFDRKGLTAPKISKLALLIANPISMNTERKAEVES